MSRDNDMCELISVIVPVYNVERYLDACIQSVLKQTYANFELLLIDDGSTDSSGMICDRYANADSRIRVFHTLNGGLSSARNLGLANIHQNSEYILFLDSDDYISDDALMNLYTAIDSANADMVIFPFSRVGIDGTNNQPVEAEIFTEGIFPLEEIVRKSVGYNGWMFRLTWNKLYRSNLFNGVLFTEHKIHEDEIIAYELLLKCKKIACLNKPYYFYRSNPDGIMSAVYSKKNISLIEAFLRNSKLLADNGFFYASRKMFYRAALEYCHACNALKTVKIGLKEQYTATLQYLYKKRALPVLQFLLCKSILVQPRLAYKLLFFVKSVVKK